jgi:hypothetical protein
MAVGISIACLAGRADGRRGRANSASAHGRRVYIAGCGPYVPPAFEASGEAVRQFRDSRNMRAETEVVIDDIKQAVGLLRRHL